MSIYKSKKVRTNKDGTEVITKADLHFMSEVDAAWYDSDKRSHVINIVLVLFLLAAIGWAMWAEIDELTRGQGQVIASQRTQVIKHLEGGILTDVLVREGQTVEIDQALARVDNVSLSSQLQDTQTQIYQRQAKIANLTAQLENTEPEYSEELKTQAAPILALEAASMESRLLQHKHNLAVLTSQRDQKAQELEELKTKERTFTQTIDLIQQRLARIRPMVERKSYSEVEYINLQQEAVRYKGELAGTINSIAKNTAAIQENTERISLSEAEFRSQMLNERNQLAAELGSLTQALATGTDKVTRIDLRSPVKGVVNRILLNTRGSVVKSGEDIMEIVPLDDTLLVEVRIRPADIAFIHPQQKAIIKITAYDFSVYGGLEAVIEQIGADTIESKTGEQFYLVKLRTKENSIVHKEKILPIMPGMVVTADIMTGKKTILQYLLKPILKARELALRER